MDIRRVFLGAVIICYLTSRGASESLDVAWLSPVEGAVFSSGDTIIAKWTSPSVLVSPGFKLCMVSAVMRRMLSDGLMGRGKEKGGGEGENENCGMTVWPQVEQAEDGYMATMYVCYILSLNT